MCVGDEAELLTPGKIGRGLAVSELYDENHQSIEDTKHPYMRFFMKVPFEVSEGDILRAK